MGVTEGGIGGRREFPSTSWSALRELQQADESAYRRHMHRLVELYWQPVYWVIRRSWGLGVQDAKDLTQEFFAEAVLEGGLLARLSPERGSFRAYLRGAISNFMKKTARTAGAQKRGGGAPIISLDGGFGEPTFALSDPAGETPEEVFDGAWKQVVIAEALRLLEARLAREGKGAAWQVFQRYDLDLGRQAVTYAEIGAEVGLSADRVKHALAAARSTLREVLAEVVREYLDSPADLERELRELLG